MFLVNSLVVRLGDRWKDMGRRLMYKKIMTMMAYHMALQLVASTVSWSLLCSEFLSG